MVDVSSKNCPDGSCPVDNNKKLIRVTDLPIVGNPYPPKDVIEHEKSGYIETQVRALRTTLQPIFSPVHSAYEQTSDFVSVGVAHSQTAIQRLSENQSTFVNASVMAVSGLLGIALARKRGFFKKALFGSLFFTGALVACYPKDAEEKARMLWYIVQNKLPIVARQQYEKFTNGDKPQETAPKKVE